MPLYSGDTAVYKGWADSILSVNWIHHTQRAKWSFEASLIDLGVMTKKKIENVYAKVDKLLEEGVQFAEDSPYPDASELLDDVYYVEGV